MGSIMYQNQAYGNQLCPLEVTRNGVYIPPTGYNGFSVADIKVGGAELVLEWDFTKSMDEQNYPDVPWTAYDTSGDYTKFYTRDENGLHIEDTKANVAFKAAGYALFYTGSRIEIEFGECTLQDTSSSKRLITIGNYDIGVVFEGSSQLWKIYDGNWRTLESTISDVSYFSNSKVILIPYKDTNTLTIKVEKNGVQTTLYNNKVFKNLNTYSRLGIGSIDNSAMNAIVKKMTIHTGLMLRDGSQED